MKRRINYFCPKKFIWHVAVISLFVIVLSIVAGIIVHTILTKPSAQDITGTELAMVCITPPPVCLQVSDQCGHGEMLDTCNSVQSVILEPPDMLLLQELDIFGELVTHRDDFGTELLRDKHGNIYTDTN